ncbi:hypothetical protein AKJ16_DCAP25852 [Drosera capensis]
MTIGGDSAFKSGAIHTQEVASKTWDHTIPYNPLRPYRNPSKWYRLVRQTRAQGAPLRLAPTVPCLFVVSVPWALE